MRSKNKEHAGPKFPILKSATVNQPHSRITLLEAYCTTECDSRIFQLSCSMKDPPLLPVCLSICLSVCLSVRYLRQLLSLSLSLSIRESKCLFTFFFTSHYLCLFHQICFTYASVYLCLSVCVRVCLSTVFYPNQDSDSDVLKPVTTTSAFQQYHLDHQTSFIMLYQNKMEEIFYPPIISFTAKELKAAPYVFSHIS